MLLLTLASGGAAARPLALLRALGHHTRLLVAHGAMLRRCEHSRGMRLSDFHAEALAAANLTLAETAALRIYTTAAFESINVPLRDLGRVAKREAHPLARRNDADRGRKQESTHAHILCISRAIEIPLHASHNHTLVCVHTAAAGTAVVVATTAAALERT